MGLLERVGTLIRANLNDLIDKAEHPSKMIKPVILDRENQLLQVKTQVAISIADQRAQVLTLKTAFARLEQKLAEAQSKSDMLLAQHRRARALGRASDARIAVGGHSTLKTFERMKEKVSRQEAVSQAKSELARDNLEDRLQRLDRDEEVDRLLADLKAKRGVTA